MTSFEKMHKLKGFRHCFIILYVKNSKQCDIDQQIQVWSKYALTLIKNAIIWALFPYISIIIARGLNHDTILISDYALLDFQNIHVV